MTRRRAKRRALHPEYGSAHTGTLCGGWPCEGAKSLDATPDSIDTIGHGEWADSLDKAACAKAWHELGGSIMDDWFQTTSHYGTRPFAWWIFERDMEMPESPVQQCAMLVAMNDLCLEEDADLRQRIAARPRCTPLLAMLDGKTPTANELDEWDGPGGLWDYLSLGSGSSQSQTTLSVRGT